MAKVAGTRLIFEVPNLAPAVLMDGLTLHFGLILTVVLVLAAVGISARARVGWLLAMGAGAFALHIVEVALPARGVAWASAEPTASLSPLAPDRETPSPTPLPNDLLPGPDAS